MQYAVKERNHTMVVMGYYSLPNNKVLHCSKLKAYADDNIDMTKKFEICFEMGRKQYGKRRKYWLPKFSLFPTLFLKGFSLRVAKSQDCVNDSMKIAFSNLGGKEENVWLSDHHFYLFLRVFYLSKDKFQYFRYM